jgi:hypothetical protein
MTAKMIHPRVGRKRGGCGEVGEDPRAAPGAVLALLG